MRGNPEEKERMKGIVEKRSFFFSVVFFFIPFYFKSIFVLKALVIRSAQVLLHSHQHITPHSS